MAGPISHRLQDLTTYCVVAIAPAGNKERKEGNSGGGGIEEMVREID